MGWGDSVDDGYAKTAPVGNYANGASPYGAMDMAGNVWEWTSSLYKSGESSRVLRGGSWYRYPDYGVECTDRGGIRPDNRDDGVGFRCAR